ncbi:MAG: MotE family protein [Nitrospinota bacterium]
MKNNNSKFEIRNSKIKYTILILIINLSVFTFHLPPFTLHPSPFTLPHAFAQQEIERTENVRSLENSIEILKFIEKRNNDLNKKEEALQKKEERLDILKDGIKQRLSDLTALEARIEKIISLKKDVEDKIYKKLAKVYQSTPPEQAGPLLSKLDVKIAAQILIRMDGKKAGKIWGFVDPEKTTEISKELTRLK